MATVPRSARPGAIVSRPGLPFSPCGYVWVVHAEPRSFADIGRDLESLKQSLIYMDAAEISSDDTAALAQEISAIRLQLKRLLAEQKVLGDEIEKRALG